MKLLVLTIGDPEAGSTKYRIVQYADFLKAQGVQLQYICRDDIGESTIAMAAEADVVLNQKCLFRTSLARKIMAASKRIVFDFDDAIWTRPGRPHSFLTQFKVNRRFKAWLESADAVVAANGYLAEYARGFSNKVRVIPMGLDLEQWRPCPREDDGIVRIGWAGSPGNLRYLQGLEAQLKQLTERHSNVRLLVYCGKKPQLDCPFQHVPFRQGTEADFTKRLDIGLLPLTNEDYLRGKSPIKAIQYLACAVPTVGNIYGATAEILTPATAWCVNDGNWIKALENLLGNSALRAEMGQAGVEFVHSRHDMRVCRQMLLEAILGNN